MQNQVTSMRALLIALTVLAPALGSGCRLSRNPAADGSTPLDSRMVDLGPAKDLETVSDAQSADATASVAWTLHASGTTAVLRGVWATGEAIVAVGHQGTIVRSEDAGQTWILASSTTSSDLRSVYGDGAEFFAVGAGGTIVHSTDKGATWQAQTPPTTKTLLDVWGESGAAVFIIDGANTLTSADHGQTWQTRSDPSLYGFNAIWGTSASDLVACADGGLYLTLDGGNHWEILGGSLSVQNDLWTTKPMGSDAVQSVNDLGIVTYAVLVGGDGGLHFGDSLSKLVLSNDALWGIWGPDATSRRDLFAVGDGGKIYHRIDKTWHPDVSGTMDPLYDVNGTNSLAVAVGANGNICTRSLQ
jgi:photosystem II stability/assembly factor-like uncharacterized protein